MIKRNKNIWENYSLDDIEGEEWRDCLDYDGYYEVSDLGRIKSIYRIIVKSDGREMTIKPRILKQHIKKKKDTRRKVRLYLMVSLNKDGIQTNIPVHECVAKAFLKEEKDKPIIRHKNHNRFDNSATNLFYFSNEDETCP